MSFASFGLADGIARAVVELGYSEPTPIQTQAIPAVLSGRDLLAAAQTGTGKTASFVLPILHRLTQRVPEPTQRGRRPVRALVLTPTRELAAQVETSVREYGRHLKLRSIAIFGGVNIRPQIERLAQGVDILVATPGRLLDHAQQRTVDLAHVEVLVLDEADRMLDMGFIHDVKRVLALLPPRRQNLLFSATISGDIKTLADRLLDSPLKIEVARENAPAESVSQTVHPVDRTRKAALLAHLFERNAWTQVLVFTRTKHGANRLSEQLQRQGIEALAIHGNKSQSARTKALAEFKGGRLRALVATDIAARGLDISGLPQVVNFELPSTPADYVHRIGRTGRAGLTGRAVSLVGGDERGQLSDIERLIGTKLTREPVPGFEPDPRGEAAAAPQGGRQDGQQRSRHAKPRPTHGARQRSGDEGGRRPGQPGSARRQRARRSA